MKQLKLVLKRILIIYVIIFTILSSMSSCQARGYDKKCGEYASKWAMDFINKYAGKSIYDNSNYLGIINGRLSCKWTGVTNDDGSGTGQFYGCCTCWVHWIYYYALGVDIYDYGFSPSSETAYSAIKGGNEYFDDVTNQTLEPGDILIVMGHAEMYAGDGKHVNFGHTPMNIHDACSRMTPGQSSEGAIAVRLKNSVQVNPAGSIPIDEIEDEDLNIYDENGFIYTGVARIEGYKGSTPFGKWIIKSILQIMDYIIGACTYFFRAVAVGIVTVIERFIIDGIVNAVTGITNKRDDSWQKNPNTIDETDGEINEDEEVENPSQASGDENDENEYISEGMQRIADIGGNIQLETSSKANVTVENIVYNKVPILDINFFNFESAGGAVVDENGIIYLLKENIAIWYYILRTLSILIMLIILIYLGIKTAISTVAEKKAVYKQMIISWIAGFILVFGIHYIMYFTIEINETLVGLIIPKYEDGTEISLYESVRTKAYSLKATAGMAGLAMYIVLVYYALRFLILYLKRYITVMILAIISPFVAVSYAVQKINKNGKGGEMYGSWIKDFTYTVILQFIHALIYTIFIQNALELSEYSITGIFIALVFMNFMFKADPILRKIFGLIGGKGGGGADKLTFGKASEVLMPAKAVLNSRVVRGVARSQAKFVGKVVGEPASAMVKTISKGADALKTEINNKFGKNETRTPEEEEKLKKERKERAQRLQEYKRGAKVGLTASKEMVKTIGQALAAVALLVAEPDQGIKILNSTIKSGEKTAQLISNAKLHPRKNNKRYKLKGIISRNRASQRRLISTLNRYGIDYDLIPTDTTYSMPNTNGTMERFTQEEFRRKFKQLDRTQFEKVLEKLDLNNLKYASGQKTLYEIAEEGNIDITELYAEILSLAKEKENELEEEFEELSGTTKEKIEEMEKVSPEFAKKMKKKKKEQLIEEAEILTKPLSEGDIYKAIMNYKAKVPRFDPGSDRISPKDIEGIAQELNDLLKKKGENIIMSDAFITKVEKELANNQRRVAEKIKKESNNDRMGSNIASNIEKKSVKEKVKRIDPNRDQNAPQQNTTMNSTNSGHENNLYGKDINSHKSDNTEKENSVQRLVKNIRNASKGTSSKKTISITPNAITFAKKLEEFESLNQETRKITGENLYDINEVLKRLADL